MPTGARLLLVLHRWTAYGVVPVFGLANAGVALDGETLRTAATSPVTIGVAVALLVGNAIGITAGTAVALRTGLGVLPGGVRWSHLMAGATLAGIGFTIALFITDLAFSDEALREQATIGILAGSVTAAVAGVVLLRVLGERFSLCSPADRGTTDAAAPTVGRALRPGLSRSPVIPIARRRAPSSTRPVYSRPSMKSGRRARRRRPRGRRRSRPRPCPPNGWAASPRPGCRRCPARRA